MEWVHCEEVYTMGDKVGVTGAVLYIGTGLAWLTYSLLFNPAPWAAVGLFNGAFG